MGFLLQASGRWNRPGEYGCLYTALTREGAVAEYRKMLAHAGLAPDEDAERDLVTIDVVAEAVLDLTDAAVLAELEVTEAELTGDSDDDLELCRTIADYARFQGYNALLTPSAALSGARNLTVYFDGVAARLMLTDGSEREALNYRAAPPS